MNAKGPRYERRHGPERTHQAHGAGRVGVLTPAALDRALAAAVDAARAAGKIALGYYHGGFEITIKPDLTPVTQADREAEQAIVGILREAFPDVGVLGEEFGAQGPRARRFIVDPIDGTKNF